MYNSSLEWTAAVYGGISYNNPVIRNAA
jgi:hypothetical protein